MNLGQKKMSKVIVIAFQDHQPGNRNGKHDVTIVRAKLKT